MGANSSVQFLADDTSMLVASACVFHRAMTFNQSAASNRTFTAVLCALLGLEIAHHIATDEKIIH